MHFSATRAAQFITLTARDRIPAAYSLRDYVVAGGLLNYGPTTVANGRPEHAAWQSARCERA
jgi:hypothetical protein